MAVFFTHRGFYGHHVIASIVLGRPPLSVVSVKVPHLPIIQRSGAPLLARQRRHSSISY